MPLEEHREQVPVLTFPRQTIVSLLVFAICWQALSYQTPYLSNPPFAVPSLVKIAQRMVVITPLDVAVPLARVIGALIASFVLGFVAVLVLFCSLLLVVFLLFVVCGPVFLIDTLDAMRSVPRELRQMMSSFRPTTLQFFVKLMLPAIVPTIFTSWKVNISLAIRVVTIAELVGAVTGIGHQLSVAQELFSVADVFAWTIVLVALLFLLEGAVAHIEHRLLRWRA